MKALLSLVIAIAVLLGVGAAATLTTSGLVFAQTNQPAHQR